MPTACGHGADLLPLEGEVRKMESGDVRKSKQLEEENRKLKHVMVELTLG
jgi:hypothetical protein